MFIGPHPWVAALFPRIYVSSHIVSDAIITGGLSKSSVEDGYLEERSVIIIIYINRKIILDKGMFVLDIFGRLWNVVMKFSLSIN